MPRILKFPDRRKIAEEAAEWLIRLDADEPPSRDEVEALGAWLRRGPAHREELEKLAWLWGRLNVLTELAVPLARPARAVARRPWQRPALIAASLAFLLVAGSLLFLGQSQLDPFLSSNGLYATAVGQQKTTTLADGSTVVLNTNSQISVEYGASSRHVRLLQGEALFTVAKDKARLFRVYAANGRIEALGTSFSVYLTGDDVQVTVTEGTVSLASLTVQQPDEPTAASSRRDRKAPAAVKPDPEPFEPLGVLGAGRAATIFHSGRNAGLEPPQPDVVALAVSEPLQPDELARRLAWRDGMLMFSGESLEEVVAEVGRYTTVSIEIPDAEVRSMRIGGRFPVGQTETMLAALETNFDLRVTRLSHDRVVLSARGE